MGPSAIHVEEHLNQWSKVLSGRVDGKARLIAIYLQWGRDLPRRFYLTSSIVLGLINDDAPHERMTKDNQHRMLARACDL